jgi:hypothetical protein
MRWIAAAFIFCVALVAKEGLYTVIYMPESKIVAPLVETGIPSSIDGSSLTYHKIIRSTQLYFRDGALTPRSQRRLECLVKNYLDGDYIAIIGHSQSAKDEVLDEFDLTPWESFWQNIGGRYAIPTKKEAIEATNRRIKTVYEAIIDRGVPKERLYTENRVDRDTIFTEATPEGRWKNDRVQLLLLRKVDQNTQ